MAPVPNGSSETIKNHASFIWSVADLLRGDYKQSEYGKVVLPLTVLRRFDCVLAPVKQDMLDTHQRVKDRVENFAPLLDALTSVDGLWNTSKFDIPKLLDDPDHIADNLRAYIHGFSPEAQEILDRFEFASQIARLHKAGLLYLVLGKFAEIDLHPDRVSNLEMGYLYEELIRRFSELSNETAGEHFTPREVIRLMVNLLFIEDDDILSKPGAKATLFDPACGTGGMLSVAEDFVRSHNPQATLAVYGQELNSESYAICRSDMMLKGQSASNIKVGNSLKAYDPEDPGDQGDQHPNERFDYLLANPPFGVEWKKVADSVKHEHETKGFAGRYGAGLPRINDGSFLFLQHMISKMRPPEQGGSRLAIVFNGSPLFTGAAGSGESEIRRWIIENDWLEAVVALPDQLFYNTGISTYFWIVTNRKSPNRKGKVQLIDARQSFTKMRKSLGEKRKEVSADQIADIVRLYGNFDQQFTDDDEQRVKIFPNEEFGFLRITVERPLRLKWEVTDASADALLADKKLAKLDEQQRQALVEHARGRVAEETGATTFDSEAAARKEAKRWMADLHLDGKPIENAIVDALAVRDPDAAPITDKHGYPEPDADLRDNENVPLPNEPVRYEPDPTDRLATDTYRKAVEQYVEQEVHPYVPDAWIDHTKTKIGYEIPLTRHFYVYTAPRPLEEIDAEIKQLEAEIQELLREVTE
jgi:type I restriction enzyme M protein